MSGDNKFRLLDLFSGMGGMSAGFARNGFLVNGIDLEQSAVDSYKKLTNGTGLTADIRNDSISGDYDVIAGGPPCRPWSTVNLTRRHERHRDYDLVQKFFSIITDKMPQIFIMENVPAIKNDPVLLNTIKNTMGYGYSIKEELIRYSDFGAATARKRFFVIGVRGDNNSVFENIKKRMAPARTVSDVIWQYRHKEMGEEPDHVWPHLKTISRYADKYMTGKYGWRWLKWGTPAPSFGNVMKTYTLHPDEPPESKKARVISVLEALRIMGFDDFVFPDHIPMGRRYQMVVDSISPVFSAVLADVVSDVLRETRSVTA